MQVRAFMSAFTAVVATLLLAGGASAAAPAADAGAPGTAKVFRPAGFHQVTGAAPAAAPAAAGGAAPAAAPAAAGANLVYNGGSVFTTPSLFIVFWGPDWNTGWTTGGFTSAQAQTYVSTFFGGVGGNSWLSSTTQYCQGIATGSVSCGTGGTHVTNPAGQLRGTWVDTTTVPTRPTDNNVRAAAQRGASHFGYVRNALYMVLTPHNKSTSGFGTQFCAYHDNTTFNGQPLAYANMPYAPDAGTSCGRNFVNAANSTFGNGFFDGLSIVAGHEYAEAVTDAFPSQTIAWLDTSGQENADKCAWNRGPGPQSASANISVSGHSFAVQSLWSNRLNSAAGGCSLNMG